MVKKNKKTKKVKALKKRDDNTMHGKPKFPYSTKSNSLRKFLELIPNKPRPPKITNNTLKGWGFKDANDVSMLRVLKALQLLSPAGEPTDFYADFMRKDIGSGVLGKQIKIVYEKLFQNVINPEGASSEDIQNFFNIHSGGSEKTIKYQIDTFKALASYASFDNTEISTKEFESSLKKNSDKGYSKQESDVRFDLHIHLPEGGSKTDYESIIENIAKHLYKRNL